VIYFPQLSSGATSQFPIQRTLTSRTAINQSCQNYNVKLADPGASSMEWHLTLSELTDQELAAIEALFQAAEGRLTPFTFLDPANNLLSWSEQQNQAAWEADPLLTVASGVADPLGGSGAFLVTNPAEAVQELSQTIDAPASMCYCFSLYARSDTSTRIWLVRGSASEAAPISTLWTRVVSSGQMQADADSISFGISLDPSSSVEIFGLQAEAQPAASGYKKTAETGGVYPNARFKNDILTITTVGPNRNSCELDILNVEYL
jgi:hypothetical protein